MLNGQPINTESVLAHTALNEPIHNVIRKALMAGYSHEFNLGKSPDPFLIEAQVSAVAEHVLEHLEAESDPSREAAFHALDTERDYQDAGFGNAADADTGRGPGKPMTRGECLLTMECILNEAKPIWYKPQSHRAVAELVRKIGGVAVQYMERYGTYPREFTPEQQRIVDARKALKTGGGFVDRLVDAIKRAAGGKADVRVHRGVDLGDGSDFSARYTGPGAIG